MKFLTAILDALVGFVQRNPLLVLLIVILALGAPSLLKGIAVFIFYFLVGIVVLVVAVLLLFRWRIYRVQRHMEEQFGPGEFRSSYEEQSRAEDREGDVKVYTTSETPGKRVSKDVGDYVEFEETKEEPKE